MLGKLLRVMVVSGTLATGVQAQVQDTIFHKTPLLTGKDALLFGAYTLGTVLVAPIDMRIARRLQDPGTQENRFLRTSATGFRLLGDPGSGEDSPANNTAPFHRVIRSLPSHLHQP